MTWYKEWFNSENYLKVYKHRDESEAEKLIELIINNLNIRKEDSVLDMACGAGRHAIEFAKKELKVTAVDLSNTLLTEAKKSAIKNGVDIDFVLSDIREFKADQNFDLVVNLFTSIGYFETDEENFNVIRKAFNFLSKDGYFVLDYLNKNYLLKNLVPTSVFSVNGTKITQERSIQAKRIVKKITIEKDGSTEEFQESVRLFSFDEVVNMVDKAGFEILKKIGDYNGKDYDKEFSPRLIVFAKK